MGGLEMMMLIQGYEVGRDDFGDTMRDRIAFEVAFSQNCLCGSKEALMTLFYSAADSIIEQTNKAGVIWTAIEDEKPSPLVSGVLFRWKPDGPGKPWCVDLARPDLPADDIDDVRWLCISSLTEPLWPNDAEWMAIPL